VQDFQILRETLLAVPGIGPWTAGYIAMRMGDKDVFLPSDAGVRHALPGKSVKEIEYISKKFQPWRSYALMHLWQTLTPAKEKIS
ncbi:MAG: DNA-3-methyladenine glycosylase, partial [Sutterellaceae bacterium]|nr:DNA-3-methyladenine glycosylase [Sutterellaceae bacterium]